MTAERRRPRTPGQHSGGWQATPAELRREVTSWTHVELIEFALELVDREPAARMRVESRLAARRGGGVAAARLREQIDQALDIGFVEWRQVPAYIQVLDDLLSAVEALGQTAPDDALEAIWHFIASIPEIFDRVHVECELEMFCEQLATAAMAMAARSDRPLPDTMTRLLDAFMADDHGQFGAVPEVLAAAQPANTDRRWLLEEVTSRSGTADAYKGEKLDALLRGLQGGSGRGRTKR